MGGSKFAELRPPYCVTAGTSGSHNVCVCVYHENAKLLIKGAKLKDSYKELMGRIVCSINNEICMIQRCANCPDIIKLYEYVTCSIEEEYVTFCTWETTDGSYLLTKEAHVVDFVELIVTSIKNLCRHHFISRKQAEHFEYLKENLIETTGNLKETLNKLKLTEEAQNQTEQALVETTEKVRKLSEEVKMLTEKVEELSDKLEESNTSFTAQLKIVEDYFEETEGE